MEDISHQIPEYSASSSKKARTTATAYSTNYAEPNDNTDLGSMTTIDQDSAFVSRLLGPLDGNITESPPTPAPIYAAGTRT